MQWFANLPIRTKLGSSYTGLALLAALVGAIGTTQIRRVQQAGAQLYSHVTVPVAWAGDLQSSFRAMRVSLRDAVLADAPAERDAALTKSTAYKVRFDSVSGLYGANLADAEDSTAFGAFQAMEARAEPYRIAAAEAARAGRRDDAMRSLTDPANPAALADSALQQLVVLNLRRAKSSAELNAAVARQASWMMIVTSLLAVGIAVALGFWVSGLISRPLGRLTQAANALATGDLDQTIVITGRDEVAVLGASFNSMIASQRELAAAAARISVGDLSQAVVVRSSQDSLGQAFEKLRTTIFTLVERARALATAGREGRLSARGQTAGFSGAYLELMQGMNDTLDAVVSPMAEAAAVLDKWAACDLRARIEGDYRGDHAHIKTAMNATADALGTTLIQVTTSVQQVSAASDQIATGGHSLSEGATQQASSLEEVAATLQEISAMTRQNGLARAGCADDGPTGGGERVGRCGEHERPDRRDAVDPAVGRPNGHRREDDRRDRVPDESVGAERRGRSSARRRGRKGLCRSRGRSPRVGEARRRRGQAHDGADGGVRCPRRVRCRPK